MVMTERADARTRARWTSVLAGTYAGACYLAFMVVFGWSVAFLANAHLGRTIDHGPATGRATAAVIDAVLLAVFAAQHSVMARPGFKRRWTTLVPRHVERSTYVLASSAAMALLFWQWRPIPNVVWDVHQPAVRVVLWTLYGIGWVWVLAMSYAIDHLDLVGLRQVISHLRGLADRAPSFALPLPHRLVRHPMMLGFFVAFFATPTMTAGHLLFAILGAGYILVGVRLEERDLTEMLPEYAAYAAVTPRFVPAITPRPRGTRSS